MSPNSRSKPCLWCGAAATTLLFDRAYTRTPSGGMFRRGTGRTYEVCCDCKERLTKGALKTKVLK